MCVCVCDKYGKSVDCIFFFFILYRHGFTVIANLIIFSLLSVLLYFDDKASGIGPVDLRHFSVSSFPFLPRFSENGNVSEFYKLRLQTVSGIVVVLGLLTEIIFYIVTKEPLRTDRVIVSPQSRYQFGILHSLKLSLLKWMCRFQFYQVMAHLKKF